MAKPSEQVPTIPIVICTLLVLGTCGVMVVIRFPSLFQDSGMVYRHPENDRAQLTVWWETPPAKVKRSSHTPAAESNIHPQDYAGPESCRQCHPKNYESWSQHPHRWMNALANETTVKGDFSDGQHIQFMGGEAFFYREDGEYRMRLERNSQQVEFAIAETIGSRFTQYYTGRQLPGNFPSKYKFNSHDHVLPFGYWITEGEWVPVVHVGEADEFQDEARTDPFDFYSSYPYPGYYVCNRCHTTFPMADTMTRNPDNLCQHAPVDMHWSSLSYMSDEHPDLLDGKLTAPSALELLSIFSRLDHMKATEHAVTLGISCEACHLGCKEHVEGKTVKPDFFPRSPHLTLDKGARDLDYGRSPMNINWACGRCHAGERPRLAAGMATWNSTEFSDAMRGACYSELTCVHCHNPHEPIGLKWTRTPTEDDASCVACHQQFESLATRRAHTHHSAGSAGDRCMNCHMPHMNEGLEDVVRTHMIYSPTRPDMIKANHPNACSLCHTDKTIDWTVQYLNEWYDAGLSEELLAESYPQRDQPAVLGYLNRHGFSHVRMVAAAALLRDGGRWTVPHLIEALDDHYLLNRQFVYKGLQDMLDIDLSEQFGYRFYMMPDERVAPLQKIREGLIEGGE